jgi:hypothetical protein
MLGAKARAGLDADVQDAVGDLGFDQRRDVVVRVHRHLFRLTLLDDDIDGSGHFDRAHARNRAQLMHQLVRADDRVRTVAVAHAAKVDAKDPVAPGPPGVRLLRFIGRRRAVGGENRRRPGKRPGQKKDPDQRADAFHVDLTRHSRGPRARAAPNLQAQDPSLPLRRAGSKPGATKRKNRRTDGGAQSSEWCISTRVKALT